MGNGGSARALSGFARAASGAAVLPRALACAVVLASALGAVPGAAQSTAAPVACHPDTALLTLPSGGQAQFRLEIADDEDERELGLMNRDHLARSAGMLFVYPDERRVAFWMRNTLIPLDMIFVDGAGRVVSVHENAKPHDETPIPSGAPVRFVLEINGGLARAIGIAPGAVLSHPAIAPEIALVPCR